VAICVTGRILFLTAVLNDGVDSYLYDKKHCDVINSIGLKQEEVIHFFVNSATTEVIGGGNTKKRFNINEIRELKGTFVLTNEFDCVVTIGEYLDGSIHIGYLRKTDKDIYQTCSKFYGYIRDTQIPSFTDVSKLIEIL